MTDDEPESGMDRWRRRGRGYDGGVADERAAVMAWLRAEADAPHPIEAGERALSPSGRGLLLLAADRIEHGEHRRKVQS